MTNRTRRYLAPLVAASIALTAFLAPPATANVAPSPAPTPSATAPAPGAELTTQFTSLTGSLMSMYAGQSGQTLESYLSTNDLMVAAKNNATTGSSVGVLVDGSAAEAAGATKLSASSVADLDSTLVAAGFGLDLRNYSNLQDMAADVVSKAHTADGQVTLAGAQWVAQLGSLRTAELTNPGAGTPEMPGIPSEALPFGLLLDQTIAGTVMNSPDLFAQASASGVGSDALAEVFSEQMLGAWEQSNQSLTAVLPNVCTGAMLAVMASGEASSGDAYGPCDPSCTTGGLYLNNQVSRIFAPADKQLSVNETDNLWNYETLLHAQDWRTSDLLAQNPALVQGLMSTDNTSGGAMLCSAASTSTAEVLSDTLGGVFGTLRTQ